MGERVFSVRTKLWLSAFFMIFGVALTGLAVWLLAVAGRFQVNLILGPLLFLVGVQSMRQPGLILTDEGLGQYNALGMRMKLRPLDELAVETEADGRKILQAVRSNGRRSTLFSTTSFMHRNDEVRSLIDEIERRKAASA